MGFWENLINKAGKKGVPVDPTERFIGRMNAKGEVEHVADPLYMRPKERQTNVHSFADLEVRITAQATDSAKAFEKLTSEEEQGEEFSEDVKYKTEAEARAYGNVLAAFRSSSGDTPTRIRSMIDTLTKTAGESTGYARDEMEKVIKQLREMQ